VNSARTIQLCASSAAFLIERTTALDGPKRIRYRPELIDTLLARIGHLPLQAITPEKLEHLYAERGRSEI
jgi:hypothetical protein